jgi:sulfatase maturation enzyme AslB (radical SAM superfamily)
MSDSLNNPLCVLPFIHGLMETTDQLLPCCAYDHRYGKQYQVHEFDTWWESGLTEIRQDMLAGRKHPGCSRCWKEEEQGISSYRQRQNEHWAQYQHLQEPLPKPVFLMMGIGNYCNIKCIMCSPQKSSLWADEYDKNRTVFNKINIQFTNYSNGAWSEPEKIEHLLDHVATDVEMLHFSGGEPLITPEYKQVLRSVINPNNVELHINTNLTMLSEDWITLLKQFKTQINVSLEGVGTKNDYIREGSDWAVLVRNIARLREAGIQVSVSHAFSRTSLIALPELIEFCVDNNLQINLTQLTFPQYLQVAGAPDSEKQRFLTALESMVEIQKVTSAPEIGVYEDIVKTIKYDVEKDIAFWKYIDTMDQLHNKNYQEIFKVNPESVNDRKTDTFCMAPWTHTYLSPQTERRMCCASREPAQSFEQYIDTSAGSGKYTPITLEQHWNGDHMRSVRRRMMAGETLPECDVCNNKLLNTDVYRSYFMHLFKHKIDEVYSSTDETGYTTMQPVSWDYRFSNLCNFKCRTCGDMLSSAWETEQKQNDMTDWANPKNNWMQPEIRKEITAFQDSQIEQEFSDAVEQHRVEEIYWVGGEPLMFEQHWRYMKRIVDLRDGPRVYARYNTNLSRVDYKGVNLYRDILAHIRDWQICASLDGTGTTGEYIRTGLNYEEFCRNFEQGIAIKRHKRQMRLDFTLTLPGMTEILAMEQLAASYDVELLAKVIFSFSPDIIMSPLSIPRALLMNWIEDLLPQCQTQVMRDMLLQLQSRPTFEEQWPNIYQQELVKGKARVLRLESIRTSPTSMATILSARPDVKEWWDKIGTN